MTKNSRQWLLLITILLTIVLSVSAFSTLIPCAHAAENTTPEKAMQVLNDVVGLNVTAYTGTLNADRDGTFYGLPQKETDISFKCNQGKLRARCTFIDDNLHQLYIGDIKGTISLNQRTTNVVDSAKGFLERYRNYAGMQFYGELRSMLDSVNAVENITKTGENVKLEVSVFDQVKVDFIWTYTDENGVPANAKNVVLSYDRGRLECFLNNWPLYKVAGTPKLSSEEAVAVALNASRNFSWNANMDNGTVIVSDFKIVAIGNATLSYLNNKDQSCARGGDPFTLYPSWYVQLGFDKFYPGGVTGINMRIWADTAEVSSMGPMICGETSSSSEEASSEALNLELPHSPLMQTTPIAIMVVGLAGVFFVVKRKRYGTQTSCSRLWGVMLCFLLSFGMIALVMPKVNASLPDSNGKSMIYASRHDQISEEQTAADWVCDQIESQFEEAGYSTSNFDGYMTTRTNVMNYAEATENGYHRVALFHFGHLADFNTAYQDNNGVAITDDDIYPLTDKGRHFFVWIWVCQQARFEYYGMPVAWTHRDNSAGHPFMSDSGYTNPDSGLNCYISFTGISPVIGNYTGSFSEGPDYPAKWFINYFYYYALEQGYSVNEALNLASGDFFDTTYQASQLHNGYWTWFPGMEGIPPDWKWGCMRVFGNGNIHLNQYSFVVNDKEGSTNLGTHDVCIDIPYNLANTGTTIKVTGGDHTFYANEFWEQGYTGYRYYFHDWELNPNWHIYYQPLPWDFDDDLTITANFTKEYHPGDVDSDRDADGDDWDSFLLAYPSTRGEGDFNYDARSDFNGDGYINYGDYSYLHGIIYPSSPWVTVPVYDSEGSPLSVDVKIDGQYAGASGSSFSVEQGTNSIEVSVPYGYAFQNYTCGANTYYDNPHEFTIASSTTATAYLTELPEHWVTITAYNQYSYPGNLLPLYVDSELAGYTDSNGVVSVLVPEGIHSIGTAYYVDDQYDNFAHFDYPQWTTHTLWYLDLGGSYWYGEAYLEVTSDMNGEAHYDSNG